MLELRRQGCIFQGSMCLDNGMCQGKWQVLISGFGIDIPALHSFTKIEGNCTAFVSTINFAPMPMS